MNVVVKLLKKRNEGNLPMYELKNKILSRYKGKRVLVTGNTGFKGSWMTHMLLSAGAKVVGYSLPSPTNPNLFTIAQLEKNSNLNQVIGDVRDLDKLKSAFGKYHPEFVIHLAAQPIVRESYKDPVYTFGTNVMGTVNVCECVRQSVIPVAYGGMKTETWSGVRSFLNVTTDKVYKNFEWEYGYREDDPLDGYDPYSNSKSCSELITHSYKDSFFSDGSVAVSTARAGNVIGGGDFSVDRIVPDCVRAIKAAVDDELVEGFIGVRNLYSTRPYQHVLEPLFAYLMIAMKQYEDSSYAGYYNVGPDDIDCVTTGDLVTIFCNAWNDGKEDSLPKLSWKNQAEKNATHEANFLKLDCSRLKSKFGWQPRWHIGEAIEETVKFTNSWLCGMDIKEEMDREIDAFLSNSCLN